MLSQLPQLLVSGTSTGVLYVEQRGDSARKLTPFPADA
jgi:hypothetical protein